ncbi:MAG TPA: PTS transporter subunit EIIC [Anaerovoracaceae bacterium]|nr:PTS transporter subunit EIIC [Anaerovoracaceae bacterium]
MNYDEIAKGILKNVGGNDNIVSILSCFTRVRVEVKDKSLVNQEEILKLEGVKGGTFFNDTYQIVFGGKCNDVYDALSKIVVIKDDAKNSAAKSNRKFSGAMVLDYIMGSIQPIIPVLIGCGLIMGIIAMLAYLNVDSTTYGYQIISAAGVAGYYFLPVILGFSTARKLGVNPYIGAVIGGILIYPSVLTLASSGEAFASFYGIPIKLVNYASTMTPILLTMPLVYWIEKFAKKISPTVLKSVLVPAITILVTLPFMFAITGPLAQIVSELLGKGITAIYTNFAIIGGLIIGATCPFFVLTGVHQATAIPIVLNEIATTGFSVVFPILGFGNASVGGASLGVALKTKNKAFRGEALSAALIGAIGITEPALYGVLLPTKKPFIGVAIMSGICGAASLFFLVKAYGLGLCGLGGIPLFLGDTFVMWCILMLVAYFGAAAIAFVLGFKDIPEEK